MEGGSPVRRETKEPQRRAALDGWSTNRHIVWRESCILLSTGQKKDRRNVPAVQCSLAFEKKGE